MDARNLCIIQGTEELMKGELDNCTISNGQIVLDNIAGRYMLYGCYTSPALDFPEYDSIMVSWNANTPNGTVVEAQVRFLIDGNWTTWHTFGKWSPYLRRASNCLPPRGPVCVGRDHIDLDSKTALQAQLRVYLYTNSELVTPSVWLLAASVHCIHPRPQAQPLPIHRSLFAPAYSQFLRSPVLGPCSLPVSLCSMMNRWGEDALPEELAMAMYDWNDHSCENILFAAAAAGCWGYPAWAAWLDMNALRNEIRAGCTVAVPLTYTNDPAQAAPGCPFLENAPASCRGQYVVVRGFAEEEGREMVLVNDSLGASDAECERSYPLEEFAQAWNGIGLVVHPHIRAHASDKPRRVAVFLVRDPDHEDVYQLMAGDTPCLLQESCREGEDPVLVTAVSESDGIVHATTAHRAFRFVKPVSGGIPLVKGPRRVRHTVYAIDETGSMLVGDITL